MFNNGVSQPENNIASKPYGIRHQHEISLKLVYAKEIFTLYRYSCLLPFNSIV